METAWYKNAEIRVDGTKLHIEVELNPKKIWTNNVFLSSVIQRLKETPAGPVSVNVSVRKLKPSE